MKVALYFGSFNPIHNGHLIIARNILNQQLADKVWFVVSPQNPLKNSSSLLNEYHRLRLTQLATEDEPSFKVSDIEFGLPKPSFTINTLVYLKEKYKDFDFNIIIGSDSFSNIHNWKNSEILLRDYSFIIYPRPGFEINSNLKNVTVLKDIPEIHISASYIRTLISKNQSARFLIPDKVLTEIELGGYYKLS